MVSKTKLRKLLCGFIYSRINYGSTEHDFIVLTLCILSLENWSIRNDAFDSFFYLTHFIGYFFPVSLLPNTRALQQQGPSVWYQTNRKKIANKKCHSFFLEPLIIDLATFKLFVYQIFSHKMLSNMAKRLKAISLAEAVKYCL